MPDEIIAPQFLFLIAPALKRSERANPAGPAAAAWRT